MNYAFDVMSKNSLLNLRSRKFSLMFSMTWFFFFFAFWCLIDPTSFVAKIVIFPLSLKNQLSTYVWVSVWTLFCPIDLCICPDTSWLLLLYRKSWEHVAWLLQLCLFSLFFKKDFIYSFLERGKGKKRRRETLIGCLLHPDWGLNPQPRHVLQLGIELVTFKFVGWCPTSWATPVRANFVLFQNCFGFSIFVLFHINFWISLLGSTTYPAGIFDWIYVESIALSLERMYMLTNRVFNPITWGYLFIYLVSL